MINKKRLAMIAVAASMVLPTNLTCLSMVTPIYAETTAASFPASLDAGSTVFELATNTTYTLTQDETLSYPISVPEGVETTIDLAGHTLTLPSGIAIKGNLTITGSADSTLTSTAGAYLVWIAEAGNLTVDSNVTLQTHNNNQDAIVLSINTTQGIKLKNAKVTLEEGSKIKASGWGIYINGSQVEEDYTDGEPEITLNKATIESTATGIYQAGFSTITLNSSTITSIGESGVEMRAGNLTVNGGTVTGKNSSAMEVKSNGNGATSFNAGIAVAQHTTGQKLTLTIGPDEDDEGATISGAVALAIIDPEGNQNGEELDTNFEIKVKDSTLTGSNEDYGYDVAYSSTTIPFTLENTTLTNSKIQKLNSNFTTTRTAVEADEADHTIPYTIINTIPEDIDDTTPLIDSNTIENAVKTDEETGDEIVTVKVGDQEYVIPAASLKDDDTFQDLTLEILNQSLTDTQNKEVTLDDGTTVKSDYEYLVSGLSSVKADSDGIIFDGDDITISVKLKDNSNVKLATATEEEIAPMILSYEDGDLDEGDAGDAGDGEDVEEYVEVKDIKNSDAITKDSVDTYLAQTDDLKEYEASDANLNLDTNQVKISGSEKDAELENGFIVIQLKSKETGDQEDPVVVTPSRPSSNKKPKPEQPAEEPTAPVSTPTTMYRLYNRLTGEHLYTIDKNERDNLLTSDTWKDEGEGWIAPSVSDYPVYRLLNPNNGDHHYTTDKNEFDTLPSYGWIAEGVAFFSADKDNAENVILHRLYNPNATGAGSHHYTADTNERDTLVEKGWTYEGLAWAGLPATK